MKQTSQTVSIEAPKFQEARFRIRGTAPFVQNKFSAKAKAQMKATQEAGSTSKKGKLRNKKDWRIITEH